LADDKPMSVWKIPFPAIRICPEHKAMVYRFDYVKVGKEVTYFKNSSDQDCKTYDALDQLSTSKDAQFYGQCNLQPHEIYHLLKKPTTALIKINKMVYLNSAQIMTEEGLCHTFNILNSSHLLRDNV
jgi:Amiloride-sensitive sodium channel